MLAFLGFRAFGVLGFRAGSEALHLSRKWARSLNSRVLSRREVYVAFGLKRNIPKPGWLPEFLRTLPESGLRLASCESCEESSCRVPLSHLCAK